ncbi:hypothetical protein PCANC_10877 [Puccinia coronata f. sp. avenae]|uniref:Uncharacterized protein n=1 Tax=Puccinia coronata f. sp. avenae TaxID=200324 RepID=A0A2N5SWQ6_9BASI|nr:hypothetical protein PCANC_10877 [Puccinia coronata f. sp. avenae]
MKLGIHHVVVVGFALTSNCDSTEDEYFDYESFFRLGYPQFPSSLADSQDPYGIRLGRGQDISPFENSDVPLVVTPGSHEEVTSASGLRAHPQSKEVFISGESTDPTAKAIDSENNIFPPESQLQTTLSPESVTPSHPAGTTGDDESSKTTSDLFYSWENISHSDPVRLNSSPEASAIPKNSAKETLIWVSKTGKYEGKRVLYWSTVYRNQKHTAQIPKNIVITKNNWRSETDDDGRPVY